MSELTEVPLSNQEVYKVLNARTDITNERTLSILNYLKWHNEIIKSDYDYETLRSLKYSGKLESSLESLAIAVNTNIFSESDRKIISQV